MSRDDEPPPPKTKRRGDGDEGRGFTPHLVGFAETAASIMRDVRERLGFGLTPAQEWMMPLHTRAMSRGHGVQTQFAATAISSGSRRNGIGFVLETFDADSTVSLSNPLGGMSFGGSDMGGFDDGFDALADHDFHAY